MVERSGGGLKELFLLLVAVAGMASSVIFIRLSGLWAGELSGWRLILGALVMLPWAGGLLGVRGAGSWLRVGAAGLLLGLHFVTWVTGARATAAAHATLLVNLVPLVLPVLLVWVAGEPARGRDWVGAGLGLCGVLVVVGGSLGFGGTWRGDLICLGSMLLLAAYIALGRRASALFPGTAAWIVPVFAVGAGVCWIFEALRGRPPAWPPAAEWPWIAGLVVFPTLLGHGLMNRALRHWRGQVVGVASSGQFLFAGLFAWLVFGELPSPWFPLGAVLAVAGVWVVAKDR
jgi:drug/metabolite transporter (DMT)-like permease